MVRGLRVALGLAVVIAATGSAWTQSAPFNDRLQIASLGLYDHELETMHGKEADRLSALCMSEDLACRSSNFRPRRIPVLSLFDRPDGRAVATVEGRLVLTPTGEVAVALEVRTLARPGQLTGWIDDIGDWSYGIDLPGVRSRDDWVQLVDVPGSPWLPEKGETFIVNIDPLKEYIVDLEPLEAVGPDGFRRVIEPRSYYVLDVTEREVLFREEIDTDFACGEPAKPPAVMPPVLRAEIRDFFNSNGTPRFSTTYTKGC